MSYKKVRVMSDTKQLNIYKTIFLVMASFTITQNVFAVEVLDISQRQPGNVESCISGDSLLSLETKRQSLKLKISSFFLEITSIHNGGHLSTIESLHPHRIRI